MLGEIRGEVRFKEPLSFHTSLRIGGPADIFVIPQDVDDIRLALSFAEREQLPMEVIGGGNNLLVSDRGFRGVVLRLEGFLGRAEYQGEEVVAGAGVNLLGLLAVCVGLIFTIPLTMLFFPVAYCHMTGQQTAELHTEPQPVPGRRETRSPAHGEDHQQLGRAGDAPQQRLGDIANEQRNGREHGQSA